tara:strand:- start:54230 stop:55990 length:1761 start_codon:yes stop_codon:yes gene_type:complete
MCGILNIINKKKEPINISRANRALSKLYWRGPDLKAVYQPEKYIFLGQTVLSLVGNIQSERQGSFLWSDSKRFYTNFNGEIYNYQDLANQYLKNKLNIESKTTDTEVLAKLHDELDLIQIPSKLDGMYVYSIYDQSSKRIYFTRDMQGEKTLYLYEDDDFFIASSQIDAIKEFIPNLKINSDALKDYFHTRHFLQINRTAYQKVKQLKIGSTGCLDLSTMSYKIIHQEKVHDLVTETKMNQLNKLRESDLVEMLDDLLSQCVRQMVPTDRKFASVLSGGIDSSLLSAISIKYRRPDVLVAINHIGKEHISNDLTKFENKINQKISLLNVTPSLYFSEINKCILSLGSPLLSHSFVGQSIQSRHVMNEGCKALFGGEGADELFGGYECYLSPALNTHTSPSFYSGFFEQENDFFQYNADQLRSELHECWVQALQTYNFINDLSERVQQAQMLCDFNTQVANVAMRGADVTSMQWSIETRSIFVRKPIVEFALNLPVKYKLNSAHPNPLMRTKYLLKKVFEKYLGTDLILNKQGFSGFPNESAVMLGSFDDFLSVDFLGISKNKLKGKMSRELQWKIINTEHFLRNSI